MTPGQLFLHTPSTEVYLAGNPGAWFARDRYGPWRAQLQQLGVRDTIPARARPPGQDGHVLVAVDFARNERGLDGFDPEATIEGLDYALNHPSHRRAEYVWNELLVPNRNLLAGTVERSARLGFAGAVRKPAPPSARRRRTRPGCRARTAPSAAPASFSSTTSRPASSATTRSPPRSA